MLRRSQQHLQGAVQIQGLRSGLFAEFFARFVFDHRHMQVDRGRDAQQALQVNLPPGRFEQIGAAHDMCNLLRRVVDHHGKLIRPLPIRPF